MPFLKKVWLTWGQWTLRRTPFRLKWASQNISWHPFFSSVQDSSMTNGTRRRADTRRGGFAHGLKCRMRHLFIATFQPPLCSPSCGSLETHSVAVLGSTKIANQPTRGLVSSLHESPLVASFEHYFIFPSFLLRFQRACMSPPSGVVPASPSRLVILLGLHAQRAKIVAQNLQQDTSDRTQVPCQSDSGLVIVLFEHLERCESESKDSDHDHTRAR